MTVLRERFAADGTLLERVDDAGLWELTGGALTLIRPLTSDEETALASVAASNVRIAAVGSVTGALSDALALADLYPAPTPEETAIIDAQVAAALANYRALDNPPADVVSLAAAVVAWRTEVVL